MLAVGFSCKDLSKMNNSSPQRKRLGAEPVLQGNWSPGASAATFRALLDFMDSGFLDSVLLENVDSLADSTSDAGPDGVTNKDIVDSELAARNYETQWVVVDCSEWGIPCRRKRIYILGVRQASQSFMRYSSVDSFFKSFVNYLEATKREPPSLETIVLPADDPAVERELANLITKSANIKQDDSEWREAHMQEYSALKLRWGALTAHPDDEASPWFASLSKREKDMLTVFSTVFPSEWEAPGGVRDISQSIRRVPHCSFNGSDY